MESLKDDGKVPEERDRLMMLVIVGARTEIDCLRMDVGMGSSSHCLVGDCRTSLVISSMLVGRSSVSLGGDCSG